MAIRSQRQQKVLAALPITTDGPGYRLVRQAEALDVFRQIPRRLADELGLDAGTEPRQPHQAMQPSQEDPAHVERS
jgi:hypothetical protein